MGLTRRVTVTFCQGPGKLENLAEKATKQRQTYGLVSNLILVFSHVLTPNDFDMTHGC